MSFSLQCHAPGAAAPPAAVFLLSRGLNTGRPGFTPGPNCFRLICSPEQLALYYWLAYWLWATGQFRPFLKGTVIPFARVGDVRRLLAAHSPELERIDGVIPRLQQLQAMEIKAKKQLKLIQIARRGLLNIESPQ